MASLSFLGGTGTVTGSKFLIQHHGFRLLVDCGLFQGLKDLRLRNWHPPPVDPEDVDMVVLTHAHLDHSGYLPVLVRRGFRGPVLATPATCDLCGILLPDAGHIMEEDARFANKHGFSKHRPAEPLYTEQQARASLACLRPLRYDKTIEVHDGISIRLYPAGHILGAALVEVRLRGKGLPGGQRRIVFTGDLGRPRQPIIPEPTPLPACDTLLLESTYGNRDHPTRDPKDDLAAIIDGTTRAGGTLLIPAFAVGRTQALLYLLRELQAEDRLPTDIPIHVDSPMAIHAIRVFLAHPDAHDLEMRARVARGEDPLGLDNVHLDSRIEDSKALNDLRYPAIIISASGMAEGGRILHHLAYRLGDHRTTVLFVGYQAVGTRGRALQEGKRTIRLHGREIEVRARIATLDSLSAHADRGEIQGWLARSGHLPRTVHLVHGEPQATANLAAELAERFPFDVRIPQYLDEVEP
jgi:metallo-beta-lactamase family protein